MTANLDAHIGFGIFAGALAGLILWKVFSFPCEQAMTIGIASCVIGSLVELWERMA